MPLVRGRAVISSTLVTKSPLRYRGRVKSGMIKYRMSSKLSEVIVGESNQCALLADCKHILLTMKPFTTSVGRD